MRFLLFFAIIGSICALQYPAEYHYHYEGQIASGIPAIRPQVAALGIKANLILQMREKTLGVARLTNIEVGEYNDDLQCVHLRQPVPFSYQSMPDPHRETLEQPFVVYFLEESGQVMDVPQSDVEFVTNIRKSIVEILRVEPILANFGGIKGDQLSKHISDGRAPEAFTVEEESILGRCESEYSLTGIYDQDLHVEKEIIEEHLKKDVQSKSSPRSRTSNIPKLEDEYFRLVRAINFDKCNDAVIQQHAGGANMSHEEYSQFRAVHSRSSVSTYILKGQPGSFRVERAIVEGDVIINPFGFKTQRLQTLTNQILPYRLIMLEPFLSHLH
ncbi:hypothetical protein Avbf_05972 [Armadillidium vulgare]|nr:hypothetical protein Avbf_05972 [Armadillidium vulgare]